LYLHYLVLVVFDDNSKLLFTLQASLMEQAESIANCLSYFKAYDTIKHVSSFTSRSRDLIE